MREAAFAAQAFQREAALAQAELDQPGARLPSAGLVWWKAQLAARRAAEKRAAEPIVWVERAAYAVGAIATLALWDCGSGRGWRGGSIPRISPRSGRTLPLSIFPRSTNRSIAWRKCGPPHPPGFCWPP